MALCRDTLGAAPTLLAHAVGSTLIAPLHRTSADAAREILRVNLESALWTLQAWLAALQGAPGAAVFVSSVVARIGVANHEAIAAAKGSIVNVTSIAGSRVHPFAGAAYSISKAAAAALTREMAADFGPWGVRVNAIAPGEINTAILSPGTEKIVETIPLRRLGEPAEVAKAIYYLCTDQSSYVTGSELMINGGQHV